MKLNKKGDKKMKLDFFERLTLLNILPVESDLTTIRIVRELREALSFSEDEHALLQITPIDDQGRIQWRTRFDKDDKLPKGFTQEKANTRLAEIHTGIDIEIGMKAMEIIRETLTNLNAEKKLREDHLGLCDKFEVDG